MKTKEILKAIFGWSMLLLFSPFVLLGGLVCLIKNYIVFGYVATELFGQEF